MLYFDRIDVSERIDINKTSESEECDMTMSMKFSDIAISNIKGSDYCCIISGISKNDAINLMQNTDLTKKRRKLKDI